MTITTAAGPPGPAIPEDFAGLSFEVGPLSPGNAGVSGYLFDPANESLVTLFRTLGLRSLRVGGGSVDQRVPVGTGADGFRGIDRLFAFAAEAGARVIYTFRLLNPAAAAVADLRSVNAEAAGYIWGRYRDQLASFAIGNEPDWHDFHSYAGRPRDPAIYEEVSGVPGSAYPSFLATWRSFADAVRAAAPGAQLSGPDTGAYSPLTWTPDPDRGVSWSERFAGDEGDPGQITSITQHYYVGGAPGKTSAQQAITNMLSPEWVHGTAVGAQPRGTTYTPYPWFYENHLARVAAGGLRYRLTEANDYLGGVPGASNGFASALWTLDFLHWWAAHGAGGVNFHNKQWLDTDTIVPDPGAPGRFATTPKGYGIAAFSLGSAGQVRPVEIANPGGINLTAYWVSGGGRGLRHDHQQDPGRGGVRCRGHDRPVRAGAAGRGGHDARRPGTGGRHRDHGHPRRRRDHRRRPLGGAVAPAARQLAGRNHPDGPGGHRRRGPDPQRSGSSR